MERFEKIKTPGETHKYPTGVLFMNSHAIIQNLLCVRRVF